MNTTNLLKDILKIASLSSHERNLADYLFTNLLVAGLKPIKHEGNVYVRIAGADTTRAIIFDAHMDTVSPGALSLWKFPPYGKEGGIELDGKVYGLGASDAKGSLASLLLLGAACVASQPAIDVWIVFVCKEETGGDGTKSFLAWFTEKKWLEKYTEISAVVCGPTNMKEIHLGHRGNIHAEITVSGDGGHGSQPELIKKHAILEAMKIVEELKQLESELGKTYADPVLGKPSIGITSIQAGDPVAPNKFPDTCSFTIDIRTTPSLHKSAFEIVEQLCVKHGAHIRVIYTPSPPGHTDPKAKIVVAAKKIVSKIGLAKDSTDLCFFSEIGIAGIILGPGDQSISHKPNEYCEVALVDEATSAYVKLVQSM